MAVFIIISTLLTAFFALVLGVFTIFRNPRSPINRTWFSLSLAVALWTIMYAVASSAPNGEQALNYLRILYVAASFIPALFFHFVLNFLYIRPYSIVFFASYLSAVIFAVLSVLSNAIIGGVRFLENFGWYENISSPGFYLFLTYFAFVAGFSVYLLFVALVKADGTRKKQIGFVLAAAVIGFAGGASNFVTDLTGIYPYGQLIVWLYPVLITYGIFTPVQIKIRQG